MLFTLRDDALELYDVLRIAHEAQTYPIHVLVQCEIQVGQVLFGKAGQAHLGIGQVDALVGAEDATMDHAGGHFSVAIGRGHFHAELTIVHQYQFAHFHILGKLLVGSTHQSGTAFHGFGGDHQFAAISKFDGTILHFAHAQLRALQVGEDRGGETELFVQLTYDTDHVDVALVAAMAEVQPANIHTVDHHLTQYLFGR